MSYEFFEPYVLTPWNRPSWVSWFGRDEFGTYADLNVGEVTQRFRLINPGTFMMGSPEDEPYRRSGGYRDETQHEVTIAKPFWIGDSPVTQEFWEEVMGDNPSRFNGPQNPVEMVTYYNCIGFCSKLQDLFPGSVFRLPSEEEWEYACRAGTTGSTYAESLGCEIGDIAWFNENSSGHRHPVKQKIPNPWGLYDMLGNVWEWCSSGEEKNNRVIRGGSLFINSNHMRTAYRQNVYDTCGEDLGLRLVIGS